MRCAKSPRLLLLCIPLARDLVLGAYVHNVIYFYTGRRNVRRNCRRKFRRARFSPRREKKAPSQSPGRERRERERKKEQKITEAESANVCSFRLLKIALRPDVVPASCYICECVSMCIWVSLRIFIYYVCAVYVSVIYKNGRAVRVGAENICGCLRILYNGRVSRICIPPQRGEARCTRGELLRDFCIIMARARKRAFFALI